MGEEFEQADRNVVESEGQRGEFGKRWRGLGKVVGAVRSGVPRTGLSRPPVRPPHTGQHSIGAEVSPDDSSLHGGRSRSRGAVVRGVWNHHPTPSPHGRHSPRQGQRCLKAATHTGVAGQRKYAGLGGEWRPDQPGNRQQRDSTEAKNMSHRKVYFPNQRSKFPALPAAALQRSHRPVRPFPPVRVSRGGW